MIIVSIFFFFSKPKLLLFNFVFLYWQLSVKFNKLLCLAIVSLLSHPVFMSVFMCWQYQVFRYSYHLFESTREWSKLPVFTASVIIPINDLRGVESLGFAKGEKLLRCKVAGLYRLVDLCGWSHGIHNHITVSTGFLDFFFINTNVHYVLWFCWLALVMSWLLIDTHNFVHKMSFNS